MGQPQSKVNAGAPSTSSQNAVQPEFEVIKSFSHPNYGKVKLLRESRSQNYLILKELELGNKQDFEKKLRAIKAGAAFRHLGITQIIRFNIDDESKNRISVFVEMLDKDLETELKDRIQSRIYFTENEVLLIAENLISVLYNLQTKGISHGDVRPANIFKSAQNYKLTNPILDIQDDSKTAGKLIAHNLTSLFSPQILAHICKGKSHAKEDDLKGDVFSLGATLLSVATLANSEDLYDYHSGTIDEVLLAERLGEVENKYSSFTYGLISDMLNLDDDSRPDFADLCERLYPHQEDIRRKLELPFFKIKYLDLHDTDLKGDATHKNRDLIEEKIKTFLTEDLLSSNLKEDQDYKLSYGNIMENDHYDVSKNLKMSQNLNIAQEHEHPNVVPSSMGILDTTELEAKVKNALKLSHDVFKHVYGTDPLLSSSGHKNASDDHLFSSSHDVGKLHTGDVAHFLDHKEIITKPSEYSHFSTSYISKSPLETKEHHNITSDLHKDYIGTSSYDTRTLTANILKGIFLDNPKKDHMSTDYSHKYNEGDKDTKTYLDHYHYSADKSKEQTPLISSFHQEVNLKHNSTENILSGATDIYKSTYSPLISTTNYHIATESKNELKKTPSDKLVQSTYLDTLGSNAWKSAGVTPTKETHKIDDFLHKYINPSHSLSSSETKSYLMSGNKEGIAQFKTSENEILTKTLGSEHFSDVEKKNDQPLHTNVFNKYEGLGTSDSYLNSKEYTKKYSIPYGLDQAHNTFGTISTQNKFNYGSDLLGNKNQEKSKEFDHYLSSSQKLGEARDVITHLNNYEEANKLPNTETGVLANYFSSITKTSPADHYASTNIHETNFQHERLSTSPDKNKGVIDDAMSTTSKYVFGTHDDARSHNDSPSKF